MVKKYRPVRPTKHLHNALREIGVTSGSADDLNYDDIGEGYGLAAPPGYSVGAGSNDRYALLCMDQHRFVKAAEEAGNNVFVAFLQLRSYHKDAYSVIDYLRQQFAEEDLDIVMLDGAIFKVVTSKVFIIVNNHNNDWNVAITGTDEEYIKTFKKEHGKDETKVHLSWWYKSDEGYFDDRNLEFTYEQVAKREYYPFIEEGIDNYLKEYRDSSSSILLLMGEPGTGKTSLLKHFIKEYRLNTMVTYDNNVMEADFFYIQYMTDQTKQLLVIEDADLLLSSRSDDGNRTMSKLLNMSEGLIKLENKKVIFTTNLTHFHKIDSALIRPGRCFDVIEFRKMSFSETNIACAAAGLPLMTEEREYTLSEVFNRRQVQQGFKSSKIGFR